MIFRREIPPRSHLAEVRIVAIGAGNHILAPRQRLVRQNP